MGEYDENRDGLCDYDAIQLQQLGTTDEIADSIKRVDKAWTDVHYWDKPPFPTHSEEYTRLACPCGNKSFEVLHTEEYETTAHCLVCGRYFVVHTG